MKQSTSKNINPFLLGNIMPGDPFCNRLKDIKELSQYAMNSASVVIYSSRRIGKSSLAWQVMDRVKKRGILTIYVDIFKITSKEDLVKKFMVAIVMAIGKEVTPDTFIEKAQRLFSRIIPTIEVKPEGISISAKLDPADEYSCLIEDLFNGLTKYLEDHNKRGIIVFDEFQEINELPANDAKIVEGTLREYIQQKRSISFFFIGSRRRILMNMFSDPNRPFYKSSFSFTLERIPKKELTKYICELFASTMKKCPLKIAEGIYDYTEGHTYYVQKLSHLLWSMSEKEASHEVLIEAQRRLLEMESMDFKGVFEGLTRNEKRLITALSNDPTSKPFSKEYLARQDFSQSSLDKSLNSLIEKDLVEKSMNEEYRLTDPMMSKWFRSD